MNPSGQYSNEIVKVKTQSIVENRLIVKNIS